MITVTSKSSEGIVTLAEVRRYLRADSVVDDETITLAMLAAGDFIAEKTGRDLFATTYVETFYRFPVWDHEIALSRYPIRSITSVQYYDSSDELQTLSSGQYALVTEEPSYIESVYNASWPDTSVRNRSVLVTYVTGHTAANVPQPLRAALLILAGWFYEPLENRPWSNIDAMINPYRLSAL
jgi:uncharacterized phiE125 gp8 family phage protein